MKRKLGALFVLLFAFSASAGIRVFVVESNSLAWVKYECTAGEIVRAFALDVTVDRGRIVGISDFFRGPSTAAAQGYGIFPASIRQNFNTEANIDWNVSSYTPLAVPADNPGGTQPGLNSQGVTLEFGALWDPNQLAAMPLPAGNLCAIRISERATVSVSPNASRGGVVATEPDTIFAPTFDSAVVQPPEITGLTVANGLLRVAFTGGELEEAPDISGPWTGTGNSSGEFVKAIGEESGMYYRVRGP